LQSPALGGRTAKKFDFGETPKGDISMNKPFVITPQGMMPEIKFGDPDEEKDLKSN
jgi:hypothetical protein